MKFQLESSKPRIFPSTSSPSTGWKFSFLVLSELAVNATCPSITVTAAFPRRILLLALTVATADSRSVEQIPSRHISSGPDSGVGDARGVGKERQDTAGGIVAARGVQEERLDPASSVAEAGRVAKERIDSVGGVEVARG